MTKLIIFEGADNVGKTTAINTFIARNDRAYIVKQHHSAPKVGEHPLDRYLFHYEQQARLNPDFILWDRGPISAFVYEGYYREPLKLEDTLDTLRALSPELWVFHRPWECVKPFHLRELNEKAEDPNGASLFDRLTIHHLWEQTIPLFKSVITTYREVSC